MVEVTKIMVSSLRRSHALLHSLPPTLQQATTKPFLHQRLPDTHRQVRGSVLWVTAPFSWVLVHKILLCPPRSICQSCVSSGSSMLGFMVTSSKKAYAIPASVAPRASVSAAVHCWPVPPQETLKHNSVSISVGSLGPDADKVCLSPLSILAGIGFYSKCEFAPPTILLGLLLCPCTWGISTQLLQRLPSYWGFSDLRAGYLHMASTASIAAAPDLGCGVFPLSC